MRLFDRDTKLETRLRADRPEPGSTLVDAIVARTERATTTARPRSLRLAFGVVTVGALTALGALGGISYAASSVEHAASAVKTVFTGKAPKGETKASSPFNQASPARPATPAKPSATSAADQYGGPQGPFLPPDTTPQQAAQNFVVYVTTANGDLRNALGCDALTGRAKTACLARVKRLQDQQAALRARLAGAADEIGTLTPEQQAAAGRLLAIHLQQQAALAAAQATRRTNCANAVYRAAHRRLCARANDAAEAAERLRLSQLELAELEAFLAT